MVNHLAAHPAERFSIAQLAELANFSDFHFHRLFKAYTGETPAELARRLRLERAAADLIYQREPSITDLAMTLGFSSSANFTKAFTAYFGIAPSRYAASRQVTKSTQNSKAGKAPTGQDEDTSVNAPMLGSKNLGSKISPSKHSLENPGLGVVIEEQPLIHLAYVRHVGPYEPEIITALFARLEAWVEARVEQTQQTSDLTYGITWSDSSVAEPQTWRYDAAMEVAPGTQANAGIDMQTLAAGKLALLKLTLSPPDYSPIARAWDYLLSEWLPDSGWQPAHRPSFERYHQASNGTQTQMQLCLPIEPNR